MQPAFIVRTIGLYWSQAIPLHKAITNVLQNSTRLALAQPPTSSGSGSFRSSSSPSGPYRHRHFVFRQNTRNRSTLRESGRGPAPRRTFLRKQKEEHNLGIILISMSTLFIICQSVKIAPGM